MDNEFIFLVLLPASLFDLFRYRIPNELLVAGLLVSLIRHLELQGLNSVWPWLAGMVIPLFLYYLLFRWHMTGASDGKMLAVAGSYVGIPGVFFVLFFSLVAGAILAVGKLLIEKNAAQRFIHLYHYTLALLRHESPGPYYDRIRDGDAGVIPYGVAIGFGTLFAMMM